MRIRLTLDINRRQPTEPAGEPERETQLDALVERSDPHPEVDRPIGFRRNDDTP